MTREEYNLFGIRTLRVKGWEIGVKAPTRLSKADLIEQIILVESGVVAPVIRAQKPKGRPPYKYDLTTDRLSDMQNEQQEEEPYAEDVQYTKENNNCRLSYCEPPYGAPQYHIKRHEFVTTRIRTIEKLLDEIRDYVVFEGL